MVMAIMDNDILLEEWFFTAPITIQIRTSVRSRYWDWWVLVPKSSCLPRDLTLSMERSPLPTKGSYLLDVGVSESSDMSHLRFAFRCNTPWHADGHHWLRSQFVALNFILTALRGPFTPNLYRSVLNMDKPTALRLERVAFHKHERAVHEVLESYLFSQLRELIFSYLVQDYEDKEES